MLIASKLDFNPSFPDLDPVQREKNNLNFYFHAVADELYHFMGLALKGLLAFKKPFVASQRNAEIKI